VYKISKLAPLIVGLFLLMGLMISYGGNQEVPQAENQESEQGGGGGESRKGKVGPAGPLLTILPPTSKS